MTTVSPRSEPAVATIVPSPAPPLSRRRKLPPHPVLASLSRHVLLDGFGIVIDLDRSRGCRLYNCVSDRPLLDLYGFFASMPVGFNHPEFDRPEVQAELLRAARAKVANSDVYSESYARFVETFARVAGLPPLERFFFVDGGSLAVENALKTAMDWKVRKNLAAGRGERGTEILHFRHAFHGRSGYCLSLTNTDPRKTDFFAKFPWPRVPAPALDFTLPAAARERTAAEREACVETEIRQVLARRAPDVAAIIIEPIQGEGGDNHFRGEWLRTLRKICDENEALLIFDEVQCGLGITGKTWTCEHFGVTPDLLVFGKKAQVCGVMAGPRLDEVKDNCFRLPSRINSTWGGNLTDMVRSTHYLRIVERERLVENAARVGEHFLAQLQTLAAELPHCLTAPRGRGLMLAFDLPDTAARDRLHAALFDAGLLALRCGEKSIRFRPVLDINAATVDEAMEILRRVAHQLAA
ncbi:MAG: L-lysine 6-transaminase [Verrucomicrobia bacterium]|nr:L-lysine 6-transaminase [Verrucomicrobiota bacterium]